MRVPSANSNRFRGYTAASRSRIGHERHLKSLTVNSSHVWNLRRSLGWNRRKSGEAIVRRMTAALTHRGPDDRRFLLVHLVGAGHAAPQHHRPCRREPACLERNANPRRGFQRRNLQFRANFDSNSKATGHRFRTRSDTEVIVHALRNVGRKLRGTVPGNVCLCDRGDAPGPGRNREERLSLPATRWVLSRSITRSSMEPDFRLGGARAARQRPCSGATFVRKRFVPICCLDR